MCRGDDDLNNMEDDINISACECYDALSHTGSAERLEVSDLNVTRSRLTHAKNNFLSLASALLK